MCRDSWLHARASAAHRQVGEDPGLRQITRTAPAQHVCAAVTLVFPTCATAIHPETALITVSLAASRLLRAAALCLSQLEEPCGCVRGVGVKGAREQGQNLVLVLRDQGCACRWRTSRLDCTAWARVRSVRAVVVIVVSLALCELCVLGCVAHCLVCCRY